MSYLSVCNNSIFSLYIFVSPAVRVIISCSYKNRRFNSFMCFNDDKTNHCYCSPSYIITLILLFLLFLIVSNITSVFIYYIILSRRLWTRMVKTRTALLFHQQYRRHLDEFQGKFTDFEYFLQHIRFDIQKTDYFLKFTSHRQYLIYITTDIASKTFKSHKM